MLLNERLIIGGESCSSDSSSLLLNEWSGCCMRTEESPVLVIAHLLAPLGSGHQGLITGGTPQTIMSERREKNESHIKWVSKKKKMTLKTVICCIRHECLNFKPRREGFGNPSTRQPLEPRCFLLS